MWQIELIDFGATRSYSKPFIDQFYGLLMAAVAEDGPECLRFSRQLGYLTGDENEVRDCVCSSHLAELHSHPTLL